MTMTEAVKSVLSQYLGFSGRARRSEYWYFTLFNFIVGCILGILTRFIGLFSIVSTLYSLAVLLPGIAVCVRRLHDIGKCGWWYFLVFIPIVGSIILIVWFCKDSEDGDNQYGPNPKEMSF